MRNFFTTLTKSVYDPAFYRGVVDGHTFRDGFRYYIFLALFSSAVLALVVGLSLIPRAKELSRDVVSFFHDHFPEELVIEITDGRASVNVEEPYVIAFQEGSRFEDIRSGLGRDYFLVIDTTQEATSEVVSEYSTLWFLGSETFALKTVTGSVDTQSLSHIPDVVIDADTLHTHMQNMTRFVDRVSPYLVPLWFLLSFFIFLLGLVYLIVGALFVWLAAWINKVRISYARAYVATLYAVTSLVLIYVVLAAFSGGFSMIFIAPLLLFIVGLSNIKHGQEQS